jgi:hypothetical protein
VSAGWSRADKINGLTAVIALLVAVQPYAYDAWNHFAGPRATITGPVDGSTEPNQDFGASGTAKHIPRDDDLWLVTRSGIEGRWYPVTRIVPDAEGKWVVPKNVIQPAKGFQEIEVIRLSISDGAQFIDYVNRRTTNGSDPGVSSIPSIYELEAVARITVQ